MNWNQSVSTVCTSTVLTVRPWSFSTVCASSVLTVRLWSQFMCLSPIWFVVRFLLKIWDHSVCINIYRVASLEDRQGSLFSRFFFSCLLILVIEHHWYGRVLFFSEYSYRINWLEYGGLGLGEDSIVVQRIYNQYVHGGSTGLDEDMIPSAKLWILLSRTSSYFGYFISF